MGDRTLSITSAVFFPFKQTTHLINGLWKSIQLHYTFTEWRTTTDTSGKSFVKACRQTHPGQQKNPSIKEVAHFHTSLFSYKCFINYSSRHTLFARSITAARLNGRDARYISDPWLPHGAAVSPEDAARGMQRGVKDTHKMMCCEK